MKKYLIIIISLLSCQDYCSDYFYPRYFNGALTNKYIDDLNHATKMIKVVKDDSLYEFAVDDKLLEFWEYIELGDSIFKKQDSNEILVKRGKDERSFNLNCN